MEFKVGSTTSVSKLSHAIVKHFQESPDESVNVTWIGAPASHTIMTSVIRANNRLNGRYVAIVPSKENMESHIDGREVTVFKAVLKINRYGN